MFRRRKAQPTPAEPFTYIHRGTTISGELQVEGRVRVQGTVRGTLIVGGALEVAEVKILGRVKANIEAAGKVEIWRQGQLEGDVRAAALDIEEGASFTGRSEMRPEGAKAALEAGEPEAR